MAAITRADHPRPRAHTRIGSIVRRGPAEVSEPREYNERLHVRLYVPT
jgi:hypothetical protein